MYTVKEVSRLLGLSEHTIRFYSDKGLVPSLRRDKNNNRIFDEEAINWLTGVKYLRDCGMPLHAIRHLSLIHIFCQTAYCISISYYFCL